MSVPNSAWVAGVDGCRGGWIVVLHAPARGQARMCVVPHFSDVLALPEAPRCIAVDMPIGLPERVARGGRAADVTARAGLGRRQSSVFAVPSRAAVMLEDYREACAVALRTSDPPRKVSKQTFNLFAKIREVDRLMSPALQDRVVECHPEAAFVAMNGGVPLDEPKKVKSRPWEPGLALRRGLLKARGFPRDLLATTGLPAGIAGADDLLDACACAWTAQRVLAGTARRFPEEPPRDARGLRQEIWA